MAIAHALTGTTTAKQMKKLLKLQKAAEKERKKNATSNPEIIRKILEEASKCPSAVESGFFLVYATYQEYYSEKSDTADIIDELTDNFEAYKRDFRKLGYCLRPQHDAEGTGYSIQW